MIASNFQEARLKDLERALELKLVEAERSAQQQVRDNEATLSRLKADLKREYEVKPFLILKLIARFLIV